jgi:hypothetical protein
MLQMSFVDFGGIIISSQDAAPNLSFGRMRVHAALNMRDDVD